MSEAVSGIEVNFANGGGAHSASVSAIEGVESPQGGGKLGKISGGAGERPVFSEDELNDLLENFVLTEKTVSRDSVKTTISRKYSDKTSLILQANILLVRGINASLTNDLEFKGNIPFWGEVSNAPKNKTKGGGPYRMPNLGPVSKDGIIIIGKTFNVSTEDTTLPTGDGGYDLHQSSVVYHNGILKDNLSQNIDKLRPEQKKTPDLTGYSLKFGYGLSDFKDAMKQINVEIQGLPSMPDVLFEYSGTFASVISSIASDIGYYWFVHPKTGVVTMVDSKIAADYEIKDQTEEVSNENVVSCSYTESSLTPVVVNTYNGSTQKDSGSQQSGRDIQKKPRTTRFARFYFPDNVGKLTYETCSTFLGLYLSGDFNLENFQKMLWGILAAEPGLLNEGRFHEKNKDEGKGFFGGAFPYVIDEKVEIMEWKEIRGTRGGVKSNLEEDLDVSPTFGNRAAAKYIPIYFDKSLGKGATVGVRALGEVLTKTKTLFEDLKLYYDNFGGIGISNGFSEYKSDRMSFINSSGVSVVGPFKNTKLISKIDELASFDNQLVKLGEVGLTIKDIVNKTEDVVKDRPSLNMHFLSFRNVKQFALMALEKELDNGAGDLDYNFLGQMEILKLGNHNAQYIGGKGDWRKEVKEQLKSSQRLYKRMIRKVTGGEADLGYDRLVYTVGKSITNKDKLTEDKNDTSQNTTGNDEKVQQLTENMDLKTYSIVSSGVSGDPLRPATLNSASGSSLEMETLKDINKSQFSAEKPLVSSSKTIYGLDIPDFKPTISSLSISVGSDGVTTTVGESSLRLIPVDMDIMKDRYSKTSISKNSIGRLGAKVKNFMGL